MKELDLILNINKNQLSFLNDCFAGRGWIGTVALSIFLSCDDEGVSDYTLRINRSDKRIRVVTKNQPPLLYLDSESQINQFYFLCKVLIQAKGLFEKDGDHAHDAIIFFRQLLIAMMDQFERQDPACARIEQTLVFLRASVLIKDNSSILRTFSSQPPDFPTRLKAFYSVALQAFTEAAEDLIFFKTEPDEALKVQLLEAFANFLVRPLFVNQGNMIHKNVRLLPALSSLGEEKRNFLFQNNPEALAWVNHAITWKQDRKESREDFALFYEGGVGAFFSQKALVSHLQFFLPEDPVTQTIMDFLFKIKHILENYPQLFELLEETTLDNLENKDDIRTLLDTLMMEDQIFDQNAQNLINELVVSDSPCEMSYEICKEEFFRIEYLFRLLHLVLLEENYELLFQQIRQTESNAFHINFGIHPDFAQIVFLTQEGVQIGEILYEGFYPKLTSVFEIFCIDPSSKKEKDMLSIYWQCLDITKCLSYEKYQQLGKNLLNFISSEMDSKDQLKWMIKIVYAEWESNAETLLGNFLNLAFNENFVVDLEYYMALATHEEKLQYLHGIIVSSVHIAEPAVEYESRCSFWEAGSPNTLAHEMTRPGKQLSAVRKAMDLLAIYANIPQVYEYASVNQAAKALQACVDQINSSPKNEDTQRVKNIQGFSKVIYEALLETLIDQWGDAWMETTNTIDGFLAFLAGKTSKDFNVLFNLLQIPYSKEQWCQLLENFIQNPALPCESLENIVQQIASSQTCSVQGNTLTIFDPEMPDAVYVIGVCEGSSKSEVEGLYVTLCEQVCYYQQVSPNFLSALQMMPAFCLSEKEQRAYFGMFLNQKVKEDDWMLGNLCMFYESYLEQVNFSY